MPENHTIKSDNTITYPELEKLSKDHKDNYIVIDTRSPKEFNESHIPNAVNMPLLSDEERHIVGILYKQVGRTPALKTGFEMIFHKFDEFFTNIEKHKDKQLIIQCARGGLRSRLVVDMFLNKEKIIEMIKEVKAEVPIEAFEEKLKKLPQLKPLQFVGGYKKYRNHVRNKLEEFDYDLTFITLYGLSCTYKTHILDTLTKKGYPVLDLEGLARHRGSVLGDVGLQPKNQKMIENELVKLLEKWKKENKKLVFVEGESRKIGKFIIPEEIFKRLKKGTHVLVTATNQERINLAKNVYFNTPGKITYLKEKLPLLTKFIGKKKIEELLKLIDAGDFDPVFLSLFKDYYDQKYTHTLKEIDFKLTMHWKEIKKLEELYTSFF